MMKRITLSLPSPYVGLRPFTEKESLLFFGRDSHVRGLLAKLEQKQRFLAVLGASGTGKSSLVNAGLIPALHRGALHSRSNVDGSEAVQSWQVYTFKPGNSPLTQLAQALTEDKRWVDSDNRETAVSSLSTLLGASPLALSTLYQQKASMFGNQALLLVVDQFEEIFRYRQRNPDEAESFVRLILRSASEDIPIYVVLTMRSDFLGNAVAFHGLPEAINAGIYLTPRLGADQIQSVIISPLALVGGQIDPILANRLVNTLSGEDELPVLEHALLRMWDLARSEGRNRIEVGDFQKVCAPPNQPESQRQSDEPMLSNAIDNHASAIYDALTPFQRGIARQFFLSLVERRDGRDIRRPQSLQELRVRAGADANVALMVIIDAFRARDVGFVLPAVGETIQPDTMIDISHESLIRRWRYFQTWLAEETLDAAELAEWHHRSERNRDGGGWLDENDTGRALRWRTRVNARTNASLWATQYSGAGSYELVDAYIGSSQERILQARARETAILEEKETLRREAEEARVKHLEAEAQLQKEAAGRAETDRFRAENAKEQALLTAAVNRRRSRIAIGLALVAIAFGILAAFSRQRANRLAVSAQAGELAALAESVSEELPDQSLLLALEARLLSPVPKADALLRSANAAYPYRLILRRHEGFIRSAHFSPDARIVLTVSDDKTVQLWDVSSGKELLSLRGHEGPVLSAQFSRDGKTVLTASDDRTARLWEVSTGKELLALRGHDDSVLGAQFSPDGKTVLTASKDTTARLWDLSSGRELRVLRGHKSPVQSAQFSPDGKTVLTAHLLDSTAHLWDVSSGKELHTLRGHERWVENAQFSPDGKTVLTASADGTARLWDVSSGRALLTSPEHGSLVSIAQFSPTGKIVLTATSLDRTARLWDVSSGKELDALRGHEGPVLSAQFSPDGKTVLTASADKSARLWEVSSGKELLALRGHEGSVQSAQFSPDSKTVLTVSFDDTARLWDIVTRRDLLT